jgi:hypothetical protein
LPHWIASLIIRLRGVKASGEYGGWVSMSLNREFVIVDATFVHLSVERSMR